jgi:SEC-C motif
MKVGRNDPCPCGSGKKYKKCCLEKDERIAMAPLPIAEATKSEEEPTGEDWEEAEGPEEVEPVAPTTIACEPEPAPARKSARPDEKLPELPPEQEKIVEDWWKVTAPSYRKNDADQLIKRLEIALSEFPSLFVHLCLHEEFMFELGAELGRRGRIPEYIALLKRLRQEQRQMYSFSYGAYDSHVIAELVVAGQVEEIPNYLDLFKQYPDAHPDYCLEICNLLAWRGHAEPLYLLCEAVAIPMTYCHFAVDWLVRREEIPFYEGVDASSSAVERTVNAIKELGERIQIPLQPRADWLRADWKACLEPPQIEPRAQLGDHAQRRLTMNFISHLRRVRKIPWVQGFLSSEMLQDYFFWCRQEKVPWWQLQKKDIEAFAVSRSKKFFCVNGVTVLAILQSMVWFAEYLRTAAAITAPEAERITEDCRQLFEAGREAVDSTDAAYRICSTFEQLKESSAFQSPLC